MMPQSKTKALLFAWGRGEDGQLGLKDRKDKSTPLLISEIDQAIDNNDEISSIVCGSAHSAVLTKRGKLFSWGRGDDGRLGHGVSESTHVPRLVRFLNHKKIVFVNCGSYHTAAISDSGELFTWGGGMYGKLGHNSESSETVPRKVEYLGDVRQVACGSRHTLCVVGDSSLYSWGEKRSGVTGLGGDLDEIQASPKLIANHQSNGEYGGSNMFDNSFKIKKIVTCGFHASFITTAGDIFTWGQGRFGRLGLGNEANVNIPTLIPKAHFGEQVIDVACGGFHTACITSSGKLFIWGGGEHGQLGFNDTKNAMVPTELPLNRILQGMRDTFHRDRGSVKVDQVVCGWSHTACSVKVVSKNDDLCLSSLLFSWGNNDHGKLGHGNIETTIQPKHVYSLNGYYTKQLASYNEHTLALCLPQQQPLPQEETKTLATDLASICMTDDSFADVTFIVEGKEIKAHRVILVARCEHFRAMLSNNFLEASQPVIKIGDDKGVGPKISHAAFSSFLHFLYTDEVKLFEEKHPGKALVSLFVVADFYASEKLKSKCIRELRKKTDINNAPIILQEAYTQGATQIVDEWLEYTVDNFESVSKTDSFSLLDKSLIVTILQKR